MPQGLTSFQKVQLELNVIMPIYSSNALMPDWFKWCPRPHSRRHLNTYLVPNWRCCFQNSELGGRMSLKADSGSLKTCAILTVLSLLHACSNLELLAKTNAFLLQEGGSSQLPVPAALPLLWHHALRPCPSGNLNPNKAFLLQAVLAMVFYHREVTQTLQCPYPKHFCLLATKGRKQEPLSS